MQYDIFCTSHVDPEIMQECKMDMTYVTPHKALQGVPPRAGGILQRKRTCHNIYGIMLQVRTHKRDATCLNN